MKVLVVAGARPNFMKIAPLINALNAHNRRNGPSGRTIAYKLIHTGQHYDTKLSKLFFEELHIPQPDINLEVGSNSHAKQTADIMNRFEDVCLQEKPSHIMVVGDVNSTIACALVASKLSIKVIHVEAGLRSFDRSMPEEINRVLTDAISDILFTTEEDAGANLMREGIPADKIHFVGNVMIDTLLQHRERAAQSTILHQLGLHNQGPKEYAVVTLHRPSNVDDRGTFSGILEALAQIGGRLPIVFPVHPRTQACLRRFDLLSHFSGFIEGTPAISNSGRGLFGIEPLGYYDFLNLMSNAKLVLTDSGGVQEETTILGVPCVTLRENTERPITLNSGTNVLAGLKKENIVECSLRQLNTPSEKRTPPLWDGKAADRVVNILVNEASSPI